MAKSNHEIIGKALDIMLESSLPYLIREFQAKYPAQWWNKCIQPYFQGTSGKAVNDAKGSYEERLMNNGDIAFVISLFSQTWDDIFQERFGSLTRNYLNEIRDARNAWAHQRAFSLEDALRALDTMIRFLQSTVNVGHEEIKELHDNLRRRSLEEEVKKKKKESAETTSVAAAAGLKPWRQIATPHPDVAAGRYQQAEFAADLFQVITGKAEKEYLDPADFYRRTYLTEGLSSLLQRAWARLGGLGGDPVVQLKTNFGGGKTHSMLALYHLFGGVIKFKDVPEIEKILPEGVASEGVKIPKANRAALVGTQISLNGSKKPDGIQVNTLWGEMAWQLGQAAGKAKAAFDIVAEDDQAGVSPGSEKLAKLLQEFSPALVLIDEWVAFARQIYGRDDLPCGSFEANITFVQSLTEAAKAVPQCMVVASLPASDHEKGGPNGQKALEHIENVFVRVATAWQPASGDERFEIVRRRLFEPIKDLAARDSVCQQFSEMYEANPGEFPRETRQADYLDRMKSSYPIHPELFDRLYLDWSTMERFQQTRGVLRLMAAMIFELWDRDDSGAMILPGFVPLDSGGGVRSAMSDYLPIGWSGVLDKDIDGIQSRPLALDRDNPNLKRYSASRRVARTIFLGSAPSNAESKLHGVDELQIKLGCAQPGESIATFGDALRRLGEELTYLYSDSGRYWFDTHPTIAREAATTAERIRTRPHHIEDEITSRLRRLAEDKRKWGDFEAVHTDPKSSGDVPDDPECRLVILGPAYPHRKENGGSKATQYAEDILQNRGNSPRLYRNMLIFLAADSERLNELMVTTSLWMAWTQINQQKDEKNLTAAQAREVTATVQRYDEMVKAQILEAYGFAIVPKHQDKKSIEDKEFGWTHVRLQGGDHLVERASAKLARDEQIIPRWSHHTLRIELDKHLWKDKPHLSVRQLWEYLAQYLYLPRLKNRQVLQEAISGGAGSMTWQDFFGYASAVSEDGRYVGLVAGSLPTVTFDEHAVIVKPEAVKAQREVERAAQQAEAAAAGGVDVVETSGGESGAAGGEESTAAPVKTVIKRFHGSVDLDPTRLGRDAGRIADEVAAHLSGLVGAKVSVTLEISAEVKDGIPDNVIRIVSENAKTLKFKSQGFEEE